jgi:dihydropteroate synthase
MGVINVTPDSFSGDGIVGPPEAVAALATRLEREGADVLDIGGESTRPGHTPVPVEEELQRVIPAVEAARSAVRIPISVDTTKGRVAREALAAGAAMINDVSGSRDPEVAEAVARADAWLVLVSNGYAPQLDPVRFATEDLRRQISLATAAGVAADRIIVDPGLGMGKGWRENFAVMRGLAVMRELEQPVLVGPSRKGMIGRVLGVPPGDRVEGTIALITLCIANGADMVRVHDVREMAQAARMIDALGRPKSG